MLLLKPLWVLLGLYSTIAHADPKQYPKSITLTYTILDSSASKPPTAQPLAEVLYDPQTLKYHLASWTPPSTSSLQSTSISPSNSQLVRISLPHGGSSSVTTLSTFDSTLSQYIDLWLSSTSDQIISASISSISPPPPTDEQLEFKRKEERLKARGKTVSSSKPKPTFSKAKKDGKKKKKAATPEDQEFGPVVKVTILKQGPGPQPKLIGRKAPQVDSEGKEVAQEEVPEKSFFQKYWWIFIVGVLLMMGGGGGGDK